MHLTRVSNCTRGHAPVLVTLVYRAKKKKKRSLSYETCWFPSKFLHLNAQLWMYVFL